MLLTLDIRQLDIYVGPLLVRCGRNNLPVAVHISSNVETRTIPWNFHLIRIGEHNPLLGFKPVLGYDLIYYSILDADVANIFCNVAAGRVGITVAEKRSIKRL